MSLRERGNVMAEYAKSSDGRVHVLNALIGEYTLCGNAFDGDGTIPREMDNDPHAHKPVARGPVTCRECAIILSGLRGVRVSKNLRGLDD